MSDLLVPSSNDARLGDDLSTRLLHSFNMAQVAQTPPQSLPGQYIQTPALNRFQGPSRSQSFQKNFGAVVPQAQPTSSQANTSQALAPQSQGAVVPRVKPAEELLTPLQRAASTINKTLNNESRYPELDNYIGRESRRPGVWPR